MKEITRVFTVELTQVSKFKNENEVLKADEAKDLLKIAIEGRFEFDNVNVVKCQDFIMEKNMTPKLTKRERLFCELVEKGFMARDKDGVCFWYVYKPHKTDGEGIWSDSGDVILATKMTFDIDFNFIQWEDDLPWAVEDLLKLEVE